MSVNRRIGFVYREREHSNGSRDSDRRILDAVTARLRAAGCETREISGAVGAVDLSRFELILSMARTVERLDALAGRAGEAAVLNAPAATLGTLRERLYPALQAMAVAMPPTRLIDLDEPPPLAPPYWLKRPDYHRLHPADVALIRSGAEHRTAAAHFRGQGYRRAFAQDHVDGDGIKFYAVFDRSTGRVAFLDTEASTLPSVIDQLGELVRVIAVELGLDIFGGDAVVAGGRALIVDVNAWPSFTTCRAAAADVIAACALARMAELS